jgi:hypothetical protein
MGEEASGVPITIFSALTRLGIYPWAEGARLSDLQCFSVAGGVLVPLATLAGSMSPGFQLLSIAASFRLLVTEPPSAPSPKLRAACVARRR